MFIARSQPTWNAAARPKVETAALWKSTVGDAKVEAYNCGGGAAYYIAKMFPYEDTRYDIGGLGHFARSQKPDRPFVQ